MQDKDEIRPERLYAPPGVLAYDPAEDRVQCHLCGDWFRALAPGHLRRHDTTADEYRALTGLNPRLPLTVTSMSQLRARQLRERIATDPRIRAGMELGAALARSGLLQARAQEVTAQRGARLQREQTLVRDGRQLGRQRARAFRECRELRARNLGFDGLEDYLRQRYVTQRVRIEDLAVELGASVSAVRGDLDRYAITVARGTPRSHPWVAGSRGDRRDLHSNREEHHEGRGHRWGWARRRQRRAPAGRARARRGARIARHGRGLADVMADRR